MVVRGLKSGQSRTKKRRFSESLDIETSVGGFGGKEANVLAPNRNAHSVQSFLPLDSEIKTFNALWH